MDDQKPYRVYLCGGPRCAAKHAAALHQHFELLVWTGNLDDQVEVQVSGCQDHCDHGPNLMVWPGPYRYIGLTQAAIERIIVQHLGQGEPVVDLLAKPDSRRA